MFFDQTRFFGCALTLWPVWPPQGEGGAADPGERGAEAAGAAGGRRAGGVQAAGGAELGEGLRRDEGAGERLPLGRRRAGLLWEAACLPAQKALPGLAHRVRVRASGEGRGGHPPPAQPGSMGSSSWPRQEPWRRAQPAALPRGWPSWAVGGTLLSCSWGWGVGRAWWEGLRALLPLSAPIPLESRARNHSKSCP